MSIDRKLWIPPFTNGLPALPCCACQIGFLNIVPDSLKKMETGPSEDAKSHDAWEVEWMDSRFTGFYRCTNPKCRHVVAVLGTVDYKSDYEYLPNGDWEQSVDLHYTPLAFAEPPPVIRVCEQCPTAVSAHLDRSFGLYWMDRRSCGTAIRTAIESLLDERGVPREIERKPSKLARIPLHDRIVGFQQVDPEPGKLLLAIKVIGNIGTHQDDIIYDDLLTAYEILEHVIDLVYSGRAARVAGLADEVLTRLTG
jgi:Domain of unknown function (DUF4145)